MDPTSMSASKKVCPEKFQSGEVAFHIRKRREEGVYEMEMMFK